jgi:hypothetical protein
MSMSKAPLQTMEASMTPFQGFTYVFSRLALFVVAIWSARYINMAFDKIHKPENEISNDVLTPWGDLPHKLPGGSKK